LRLCQERLTERTLGTATSELEGDIYDSGSVPQHRHRGPSELGEAVDVREVERVADGGLARVVWPEQDTEAAWKRTSKVAGRAGTESPDGDRAQVHGDTSGSLAFSAELADPPTEDSALAVAKVIIGTYMKRR
jgi:hypothetical protein